MRPISKKPNGAARASSMALASSRLAGVPITEPRPPSSVAKDTGISSDEAGMPCRAPTASTMGMTSARAPILFMNTEIAAESTNSAKSVARGPVCDGQARPMASSRWLRLSTPMMRRISSTVMTVGLAKPENTAPSGTRPSTKAAASPRRATISMRKRPDAKSATMAARRRMRLVCASIPQ